MALALPSTLAPRLLPLRLPKVCLALSADTVEDMLATAESMARDDPFLEFRLDYLKQPVAALTKIHRFLETHQYVTAIATCRRVDSGGKFKGSLASQLEVLTKAHAAGCLIVDLELQSALKAKPEAIARLRSRAGLILSFHDFRATRNLEETLEKMLKIPADFYKVVTTATTLFDNVAMMKLLQTQSDKHALIGLCMGEHRVPECIEFVKINPSRPHHLGHHHKLISAFMKLINPCPQDPMDLCGFLFSYCPKM